MKQAVQKAEANRGIEQIYLTVVSTNESAKKLYQSMGFKRYGVDKQALKLDNNVYLDEDLMVLDIKERIG
ncbi:GNAT family N-acetyltransferase [Alkalicoccobacillus plakortidis]|uniref:GNAT family N-acetyltransferase n=1 Tax=Alkalicoccobacillus plakortidis TaxID=444060 RepID=UPI00280C1199|nr:GNAT family protein [Alkalicoccobacillus plakortidis]